ncbi:hypothetical protein [Gilvimarinus algae]|uniref:Uncharacterized protein n=1 Tax=Gilvimarinus algae TaxID=3058037 RepID=A0ABT8TDW1_9GAMM|nr:hypothetical protein [Gilvimarinus sp. SDUM040014]MDO3382306.1 hypothetical protein [Gilvimarinus sp. SDUM040014]
MIRRFSLFRSLGRYRRLAATCFLSCLCFIGLAVYGWGVSWREVGSYAFAALVLLLGTVAVAAFTGWLLYLLRKR